MKRKITRYVAALLVTLTALQASSSGTITYTATYDPNKMSIGTDTLGGVTYTTVHYEDLFNGGEPGMPSLPIDYIRFSVPYNATDYTVCASISNTVNLSTNHLVYPCQQHDWHIGGTVPITLPDTNAYYSNTVYPSQRVWVADNGFMAGENRVVTVAVMPVGFLHTYTDNTVRISTQVEISLSYVLNGSQSTAPLVRNDATLRNEGHEITKTMVVNPDDVVANAPMMGNNTLNNYVDPDEEITEPYSYLIVTTPEYLHSMRKLAALKRQEGYTVKLTTLEDAISQPYAIVGDRVPLLGDDYYQGPVDDAGKLRQFIRYHYLHHGTVYVLLAGSIIPHRDYANGCTDMYFCDLGSTWEYHAGTYPAVYVGRLLGKTENHFDNYNEKLFRYELNPGNGNLSYLRKGLFFESDPFITSFGPFADIFPDETLVNSDELEQHITGDELIGMINNNHYGFLGTLFDSNPLYSTLNEENGTLQAHYIWAKNSSRDPLVVDSETNNALDCLTNKYYPMVFFTGFGNTISYHDNVNTNIGESFTMGKDYGGPVHMGQTNNLMINTYTPYYYYFPSLAWKLAHSSDPIGKSYALAKSIQYISNEDHEKVCIYHNYLGDPSVMMWNDIPHYYSNIILTRGDSSITVSGISEASTTVALYSNDGKTTSQKTSASNVTFSHVSPNSTVMLYKRNCIPLIAPLVLQNTTINQSQYVIASDMTAGKAVDSGRTSGQVTITGDIEYEVEHTGEVRFCGGFKVDKGVKFSVKPSNYNK